MTPSDCVMLMQGMASKAAVCEPRVIGPEEARALGGGLFAKVVVCVSMVMDRPQVVTGVAVGALLLRSPCYRGSPRRCQGHTCQQTLGYCR